MKTPDDETLLTAYLDNELDADPRLEIETTLLSNPTQSDRLRELAAVRDLVSGLSRPTLAVDLTPRVLAKLDRRLPNHLRLAGFGVAAAVVAALTIALSWNRGHAPAVRELTSAVPPAPLAPGVQLDQPTTPRAIAPVLLAETRRLPSTSSPQDVEAELAQEEQRNQVRTMLDNPTLNKVFIVTDVIGAHADERINELIHDTPRIDPAYGRITISQGILIDPRHPDLTTVFALAMDPQELQSFQAKLNEAFPGAVENAEVDPTAVTQLADINQMTVLPGNMAVDLVPPVGLPSGLAMKRPLDELDRPPDDLRNSGPANAHDRLTFDVVPEINSLLAPSNGALAGRIDDRPLSKEERDRARRSRSEVVLVWVASRKP
jgi:hypothetical protein